MEPNVQQPVQAPPSTPPVAVSLEEMSRHKKTSKKLSITAIVLIGVLFITVGIGEYSFQSKKIEKKNIFINTGTYIIAPMYRGTNTQVISYDSNSKKLVIFDGTPKNQPRTIQLDEKMEFYDTAIIKASKKTELNQIQFNKDDFVVIKEDALTGVVMQIIKVKL